MRYPTLFTHLTTPLSFLSKIRITLFPFTVTYPHIYCHLPLHKIVKDWLLKRRLKQPWENFRSVLKLHERQHTSQYISDSRCKREQTASTFLLLLLLKCKKDKLNDWVCPLLSVISPIGFSLNSYVINFSIIHTRKGVKFTFILIFCIIQSENELWTDAKGFYGRIVI